MSSDVRGIDREMVSPRLGRRVLVIADDELSCLSLERVLTPDVQARSARSAADTEGLDVDLVVLSGAHPLAELIEVRAHPSLFAKPVVIFAPGKDFGSIDLRSLGVASLVCGRDAVGQLLADVDELLTTPQPIPGNGRRSDSPRTA